MNVTWGQVDNFGSEQIVYQPGPQAVKQRHFEWGPKHLKIFKNIYYILTNHKYSLVAKNKINKSLASLGWP